MNPEQIDELLRILQSEDHPGFSETTDRIGRVLADQERRLRALESALGLGPEIARDAARIRAVLDDCSTYIELDWLARRANMTPSRALHVVRAANIQHRWLRR